MNGERVTVLFAEFQARYLAGEQPDVADYLDRARFGADELGDLIEAFLLTAPAPDPTPQAVAQMRAWLAGDAPLVALRASQGIRRDDLIDTLIRQLQLDPHKRPKIARYLHELEAGLLDIRRVHRSVLDTIAARLGTRTTDLLAWPGRPQVDALAYRADAPAPAPAAAPPAMARAAAPRPERDEIDRLFLGDRP